MTPAADIDLETVRFGSLSVVETGDGASPETYSRRGSGSGGALHLRFSSVDADFTDEDRRAVLVAETEEGSMVTGFTEINNVKREITACSGSISESSPHSRTGVSTRETVILSEPSKIS